MDPMPVIVLNVKDHPNARIFSLLHEFCHLILANGETPDVHDKLMEPQNHLIEIFCNAVAGETLVPSQEIADFPAMNLTGKSYWWEDSRLKSLAKKFSIPLDVILRQLLITNKITDGDFQEFRIANPNNFMP